MIRTIDTSRLGSSKATLFSFVYFLFFFSSLIPFLYFALLLLPFLLLLFFFFCFSISPVPLDQDYTRTAVSSVYALWVVAQHYTTPSPSPSCMLLSCSFVHFQPISS